MGGICVQEWGNPVANKSTYDLMLSYSPVDNVKEQAYPSMLVIGGLSSCHIAVICGKLQMICTQSSMTLQQITCKQDVTTATLIICYAQDSGGIYIYIFMYIP